MSHAGQRRWKVMGLAATAMAKQAFRWYTIGRVVTAIDIAPQRSPGGFQPQACRLKPRRKGRSPCSRPGDHLRGRDHADVGRRSAAPGLSGAAPKCGFNRDRGLRRGVAAEKFVAGAEALAGFVALLPPEATPTLVCTTG